MSVHSRSGSHRALVTGDQQRTRAHSDGVDLGGPAVARIGRDYGCTLAELRKLFVKTCTMRFRGNATSVSAEIVTSAQRPQRSCSIWPESGFGFGGGLKVGEPGDK